MADLHLSRRMAADHTFVTQHGPDATIRFDADLGRWQVEAAEFCAAALP
ncbi:hypothetical protein [uncultured Jannaschia sp.]|nr:hypothetical protein [uncultured Jannaschia sp.]